MEKRKNRSETGEGLEQRRIRAKKEVRGGRQTLEIYVKEYKTIWTHSPRSGYMPYSF